jgi:hypothetical protein
LTLRLLPSQCESIAVAYLVARLSDTLADGAETEAEKQLLRDAPTWGWLWNSPDRGDIRKGLVDNPGSNSSIGTAFQRPFALSVQELDRSPISSPDVSESSGPGFVERKSRFAYSNQK